jgi:hypothetical protein
MSSLKSTDLKIPVERHNGARNIPKKFPARENEFPAMRGMLAENSLLDGVGNFKEKSRNISALDRGILIKSARN